jgi:hypothetical protein
MDKTVDFRYCAAQMINRALNTPGSDQKTDDKIEIRDQSGDPFTAVWNWLLDCRGLSGTEKLVWIALKSYAGYREIRPSVQTVARRAGVSIRTVQRTIIALTTKSLLRVERRSRPDGGFAANRYILLSPPRPHYKTADEGRHQRVTSSPGVMTTPAPDDIVSPPQVSRWHQEKIKIIKNKKTTPLTPLKTESGTDRVVSELTENCTQDQDRIYREAQAKLSALTEEGREDLFAQAKTQLPHFLRKSHQAVKAKAIEMLLSQARAPDAFKDSETLKHFKNDTNLKDKQP